MLEGQFKDNELNGWARLISFVLNHYKYGELKLNVLSKCYIGWFKNSKKNGFGI